MSILNFDDLEQAFGGIVGLAAAGRVNRQAVSNWRSRGAIPAARWPLLVDAAERQGINLDYDTLRDIQIDRERRKNA